MELRPIPRTRPPLLAANPRGAVATLALPFLVLVLGLFSFSRPAGAAGLGSGRSQTKLQPKRAAIGALARSLASRIPRGSAVYVSFAFETRKRIHYLLEKHFSDKLAASLAAAAPADKIIAPDQSAGIFLKAGVDPLDVYFILDSNLSYAQIAARETGASALVFSRLQVRKNGVRVKASAYEFSPHWKRIQNLTAWWNSPASRILSSLPQTPINDGRGAYLPEVGGIGYPVCLHCPLADGQIPYANAEAFYNSFTAGTAWEYAVLGATATKAGKIRDVNKLALVVTGMPNEPVSDPRSDQSWSPQQRKTEQAELNVIGTWRFKPAKDKQGDPVATRIMIFIPLFRLAL